MITSKLPAEDSEKGRRRRLQDYIRASESVLPPQEHSSNSEEETLRKFGLGRPTRPDKGKEREHALPHRQVLSENQGSKRTTLEEPTGPIGSFRLPTTTTSTLPEDPIVSSASRTPKPSRIPSKGTPEWRSLVTSRSKEILEALDNPSDEDDRENLSVEMLLAYNRYISPFQGQQSLKQAVERLLARETLLPHDIVDLGPSPPEGWKRYVLKPLVYESIEGVIHAVQDLLNRMISLPTRRKAGSIYPKG
ncbi:hypothetical protein NLI96_g11950 [Meripilus lineatus]|uniref:Uncharacterized protein n=1 Tax=Meripilus lineatus TaxID=2056292 RepID=A0AAD5UUY6_9APHY|nr:hypothetical protein NLI96_g11950 [Physisporinus lineatus]